MSLISEKIIPAARPTASRDSISPNLRSRRHPEHGGRGHSIHTRKLPGAWGMCPHGFIGGSVPNNWPTRDRFSVDISAQDTPTCTIFHLKFRKFPGSETPGFPQREPSV